MSESESKSEKSDAARQVATAVSSNSRKPLNSRNNTVVFHVAMHPDLHRATSAGQYVCDSLAREGFIHCCLSEQLPGVLERYFSNTADYTVIQIDVASLPDKLKPVFENTVGGTELFPHIYGALPPNSYKPI